MLQLRYKLLQTFPIYQEELKTMMVSKQAANKSHSAITSGFIRRSLAIAATSVLVLASGQAAAGQILYELTTTLPGMVGWDINEKGQVVGTGYDNYARLYTPGVGIVALPRPDGARGTYAYGINEAGQVAAKVAGLPEYDQYGFRSANGMVYTPGANPVITLNHSEVGFEYHLNEAGVVVKLNAPLPPAPAGFDRIILGQAGGYAVGNVRGGYDGYGQAWRGNPDGTFTDIQAFLPVREGQAYGVNASGTAVGRGVGYNRDYPVQAFVFNDGIGALNLFDVTDPTTLTGWSAFVSAQDITSDGRITGWGAYSGPGIGGSYLSGFILTPIRAVPEPSTLLLFVLAAVGLFLSRRNRERR